MRKTGVSSASTPTLEAFDARRSPGQSDSRQGATPAAAGSALEGGQVGSKDAQPSTTFSPPLDRARQQRILFFLTLFDGLWAKKATSRRVPELQGGRGPSRLPTLCILSKEIMATATNRTGRKPDSNTAHLLGQSEFLLNTQTSELPCEWDCNLHPPVL